MQERLGITNKEVKKIRGDKRTTAPGYSNLVESPESCSGGGVGSGSSGSRSGEGLSTGIASLSPFVDFLLDHLRVTKGDAKQLVLINPGVLTMSAAAADRVSRWLEKYLGMQRREVAQLLLRYPEAGQLSVKDTIKPVIEWLRKTVCPNNSDVVMVLRQAPRILGQSIEGSLKPMMALLERKLGVSGGKAANLSYICLAILTRSVENDRNPTLAWLSEQLSTGDLSAMIDAVPKCRGMNFEKGLEQNLIWLQNLEALKCEEIRRTVRGCPSITCSSSIRKKMEPVLTWMKEDLGMDKNAAMAMLMRCPGILKSNLDRNLKLKLQYLRNKFYLTKEEVVALVIRCPMLLVLSAPKNLDPTIEFYRVEMGVSNKNLVQNPTYLMSSLENRIRPRVAMMRSNGIEPLLSRYGYKINTLTNDRFEEFVRTEGNMF